MRREDQRCGDAAERSEGESEADLVVQGGEGLPGGGVARFREVVVVLEEGEAAFGLGVLEPGGGGGRAWDRGGGQCSR